MEQGVGLHAEHLGGLDAGRAPLHGCHIALARGQATTNASASRRPNRPAPRN
jgi:hypothetical protein